MPSQKTSFIYNRPSVTLVLAILLASATSCFISLIASIAYTGWLESAVGIQPTVIFLILLVGIFIWLVFKLVNEWFSSLTLDEYQISLKPLIRRRVTLNREDIQKWEWDQKKVIFSTGSEKLEFHFNSLPIKSKIELFNLLPAWLPSQALLPEVQTWAREVEKLAVETPPSLEIPVRASASLRYTLTDPGHFVIIIMVLIAIASVTYGVLLILEFGIVSLIAISVCLAFAGAVTWSVSNKYVEISNEGLEYQVGFSKKSFLWDEIETVAVQPCQGQIIVWVKGRYSQIPLVGLNPEQLVLFQEAFSQQVFARRIPFGYA